MQGLDLLAICVQEYINVGAIFAKCQSPIVMDVANVRPTKLAICTNMEDLAHYAHIYLVIRVVVPPMPMIMINIHTLISPLVLHTTTSGIGIGNIPLLPNIPHSLPLWPPTPVNPCTNCRAQVGIRKWMASTCWPFSCGITLMLERNLQYVDPPLWLTWWAVGLQNWWYTPIWKI